MQVTYYPLSAVRSNLLLTAALTGLTLERGGTMRLEFTHHYYTPAQQDAVRVYVVDPAAPRGWMLVLLGWTPIEGGVPWRHSTHWYVHPRHRRQGVGRALAEAGLEWAARYGRQLCYAPTHENKKFFESSLGGSPHAHSAASYEARYRVAPDCPVPPTAALPCPPWDPRIPPQGLGP